MNLLQHLKDGQVDQEKLKRTISTAMRMLDNVIDINYYAVKKARDSNLRHRPVGLGLMGFQDSLYALRIPIRRTPEPNQLLIRRLHARNSSALARPQSLDLARALCEELRIVCYKGA